MQLLQLWNNYIWSPSSHPFPRQSLYRPVYDRHQERLPILTAYYHLAECTRAMSNPLPVFATAGTKYAQRASR